MYRGSGPAEETERVRWIFRAFIQYRSELRIARLLNDKGVFTPDGKPWSRDAIHSILTNEKYIGHNFWNKTCRKLSQRQTRNPSHMWIRGLNSHAPIVDQKIFQEVQAIISAQRPISDAAYLALLQQLYDENGLLSHAIIKKSNLVHKRAYLNRFKNLESVYQLINRMPPTWHLRGRVSSFARIRVVEIKKLIKGIQDLGGEASLDPKTFFIKINNEITVWFAVAPYSPRSGRAPQRVKFNKSTEIDLTIVARLDVTNKLVRDYFVLPDCHKKYSHLSLSEAVTATLEPYRSDTLQSFFEMNAR